MWIAREENGDLYLFSQKPKYNEEYISWEVDDDAPNIFYGDVYRCETSNYEELDPRLYPEVTFENSPIQLKLML